MKKIDITVTSRCLLALLSLLAVQQYVFADTIEHDLKPFQQGAIEGKIQDGDIIFQTSTSSQSKAIQIATQSAYSHMGIIYYIDGRYFVYEAIQPVSMTPLSAWIRRGENQHYVVKRLKNAAKILTSAKVMQMQELGKQYLGKPYDSYFEWSSDRLYCSELVWKIYKEATGIEIGALMQLADFDLSHAVVKAKMRERYGNTIPLTETVIAPATMFHSDQLILVAKGQQK